MNNSYVISVRVYKGCYKHIQINGDCTLTNLAYAILDSFDFDDDHLSCFYIKDYYGRTEEYGVPNWGGVDAGEKNASNYTLNQLDLKKGTQFLYLFDFGDNWEFKCKVLRIVDKMVPGNYEVIKSVGENPEQYPEWED